MSAPLNSNPEVLLRKRRNAERTRLEKQEQAKKRRQDKTKRSRKEKNRFIRMESIVAKTLATTREKERIKRISKLELKKSRNDVAHLPSDRSFILKVTEKKTDGDDDDGLVEEKILYDGEPTLLFVIRVKGPTAANIPSKAFKILSLLRLDETNTGVFLKLTNFTYSLLRLISPYVIIGTPSLSSIRSLIQKRSRINHVDEKGEATEIVLNDNSIIEEKLGQDGIICMEDIIHEIATLGEAFNTVNFFLKPFKLNREVSGFSALSKLNKIKSKDSQSKLHKHSNSAVAPVVQIDIDELISKLN